MEVQLNPRGDEFSWNLLCRMLHFSFSLLIICMELGDLPSDLLIEIISHVKVADIPNVALVNKKWYKVAKSETIWKQWCQR